MRITIDVGTPEAKELASFELLVQKPNRQVIALLFSNGTPTAYCHAEANGRFEPAHAIFTGSLASATDTLSLIAE
jgi:hypothetical protein